MMVSYSLVTEGYYLLLIRSGKFRSALLPYVKSTLDWGRVGEEREGGKEGGRERKWE